MSPGQGRGCRPGVICTGICLGPIFRFWPPSFYRPAKMQKTNHGTFHEDSRKLDNRRHPAFNRGHIKSPQILLVGHVRRRKNRQDKEKNR